MAEFDDKMDNWKQFQGTELGGLMARLYGSQNSAKINYPKPKTKEFKPKDGFRPVCNRPDAEDPRKTTKVTAAVAVPRLSGRKASSDNIDDVSLSVRYISKRKSESVIRKELDEIQMRQEHYRPAYVQPISSEQEKDRLNQIFSYKGGKCLPDELTNPVAEAPFEVAQRQKERARIDEIKIRRGLAVVNSSKSIIPKKLDPQEQLLEQITAEINERREYLDDLKSCGGVSKREESRILMEISQRVRELEKLEHH